MRSAFVAVAFGASLVWGCPSTSTGTVVGSTADAVGDASSEVAAADDATADSATPPDSATLPDSEEPDVTVDAEPDGPPAPDASPDVVPDVPDVSGCQPLDCDDGNVCNGVEFCSVLGACEAGTTPACGGQCSRGTCTPDQGCGVDFSGTCVDVFDWGLALLRWDGELTPLRDALQWEFAKHGCGFQCSQSPDGDPACGSSDSIGSQSCSAPAQCSFGSVVGELNWLEHADNECAEFSDVTAQSLTASQFYLKQSKQGSADIVAADADWRVFHYYGAPTVYWSTVADFAVYVGPGIYPAWAPSGAATTISATGNRVGYSSDELWALLGNVPGHSTAGSATTELQGQVLTALWDVQWQAYYDAGTDALPSGCDLEPVSGTMTLTSEAADGSGDVTTHVVTFDGATTCDGCGQLETDGVATGDHWCGELPSVETIPAP